jgi:hypothetical protein
MRNQFLEMPEKCEGIREFWELTPEMASVSLAFATFEIPYALFL